MFFGYNEIWGDGEKGEARPFEGKYVINIDHCLYLVLRSISLRDAGPVDGYRRDKNRDLTPFGRLGAVGNSDPPGLLLSRLAQICCSQCRRISATLFSTLQLTLEGAGRRANQHTINTKTLSAHVDQAPARHGTNHCRACRMGVPPSVTEDWCNEGEG